MVASFPPAQNVEPIALSSTELCRALYNAKYHYHNEKELQLGVRQVLDTLKLDYKSEAKIGPRDRIDFLVGDIGIECKSDDSSGGTSLAAVTRQLHRYAQSDKVKEVILLTTMSKHKNLPDVINQKPLYIVHLLLSFL
jgi:hypothetical protein